MIFFQKLNTILWKLKGLDIGKNCVIENKLHIRGIKYIKIGSDSYISDSVSIKTSGGKIKFGDNILIRDGVKIQGGSEESSYLKIGNYFSINHNSSILFNGGVEIGNFVMIGSNVTITSGGHSFNRVDMPMRFQKNFFKKIVIEDDVWIGSNSVILAGVTIKRGSVIGAGSVVTKDIEPFSIVGGIPAKVIKYRSKNGLSNL